MLHRHPLQGHPPFRGLLGRLAALEEVEQIGEVELGRAAAQNLELGRHHRDLGHADVANEERQVVEPHVDALDLVRAFVDADLLDRHALQRQVAREEIQVDVVQLEDALGELGDLSDRDSAHDLGQNRHEQPTEHDHRHEDADQDLARAAGNAKHQTSTPNQLERWYPAPVMQSLNALACRDSWTAIRPTSSRPPRIRSGPGPISNAFRAHSTSTRETSWNMAPGFFHSVPRRSRVQPVSSSTAANSATQARIRPPLVRGLRGYQGISRAGRLVRIRAIHPSRRSPRARQPPVIPCGPRWHAVCLETTTEEDERWHWRT